MELQWEVSCIEFLDGEEQLFKVTQRVPALSVSETRLFRSKDEAVAQLTQWL